MHYINLFVSFPDDVGGGLSWTYNAASTATVDDNLLSAFQARLERWHQWVIQGADMECEHS